MLIDIRDVYKIYNEDTEAEVRALDGVDLTEPLLDYLIEVASGRQTCNERNHYEEISIFKDGVTL